MERLTNNRPVQAMGMYELAHNNCYSGYNKVAMYRDYDKDINCRDYIRQLMIKYSDWKKEDIEMQDDDSFDETMLDNLQYGEDSIIGIIALLYLHMWSKADLYERLKIHEDLEIKTAISLIEKMAEEIENLYGRETELTIQARDYINRPTEEL